MLSTARKIAIARSVAATLLGAGMNPRQRVRRRGVTFDLDLKEGIDLSLFLFGSFQQHVVRWITRTLPADGTMIDVGANIGAIALPVAARLASGLVYAIEPTDYAFEKLQTNLALNPNLSGRVVPIKTFVADSTRSSSDLVAYSSWPLGRTAPSAVHPVHRGMAKAASAGQVTLDDLVVQVGLRRLSLVKIDTDGHEFEVFSGAARCMAELRPLFVFEACEYLMRPPRPSFEDFESLLGGRGYVITSPALDRVSADRFRRQCPAGSGLDLMAVPSERLSSDSRDPRLSG